MSKDESVENDQRTWIGNFKFLYSLVSKAERKTGIGEVAQELGTLVDFGLDLFAVFVRCLEQRLQDRF